MATTLSAIAEFENNRRKERQKQGIRAAQKKGKYQGRKTVINKALIQKVKHLKETKNLSVTDISKLTGVSCPTIYKVLKEHLGYVSNRLIKLEETNETLEVDKVDNPTLTEIVLVKTILKFFSIILIDHYLITIKKSCLFILI